VPTPHSAAVDFAKQPAHVDDTLCVAAFFLLVTNVLGKIVIGMGNLGANLRLQVVG
jgi:hypothetical protein